MHQTLLSMSFREKLKVLWLCCMAVLLFKLLSVLPPTAICLCIFSLFWMLIFESDVLKLREGSEDWFFFSLSKRWRTQRGLLWRKPVWGLLSFNATTAACDLTQTYNVSNWSGSEALQVSKSFHSLYLPPALAPVHITADALPFSWQLSPGKTGYRTGSRLPFPPFYAPLQEQLFILWRFFCQALEGNRPGLIKSQVL